MARMSGAAWQGERSPRSRMSRHDIVCIHTIVGYAPAHAAHFSTSGSGKIYQSRNTRYRSAANLNGNHRVIAIENADYGSMFGPWRGDNAPHFTDKQAEAIAQILAWAHKKHKIPLALVKDSKPGRRGIAYHRQGCDGNFAGYKYGGRVSGGEKWSNAYGKVCPTDNRIDQIPGIIRRAKQIVSGKPPAPPEPPKSWLEKATKNDVRKVLLGAMRSGAGRDAIADAVTIGFRHNSEFKDEFRKAVGDAATIAHRHREDYGEAFETDVRQAVRKE